MAKITYSKAPTDTLFERVMTISGLGMLLEKERIRITQRLNQSLFSADITRINLEMNSHNSHHPESLAHLASALRDTTRSSSLELHISGSLQWNNLFFYFLKEIQGIRYPLIIFAQTPAKIFSDPTNFQPLHAYYAAPDTIPSVEITFWDTLADLNDIAQQPCPPYESRPPAPTPPLSITTDSTDSASSSSVNNQEAPELESEDEFASIPSSPLPSTHNNQSTLWAHPPRPAQDRDIPPIIRRYCTLL